ncbi:MAG: hypothetical protein ABR878_13475 [Roseiarcus sp.]|jgi:hypothetical protein
MPRTNPRPVTAKYGTIVALSDALEMMERALIEQSVTEPEMLGSALTERNVADPDEGIDAAMDYRIPRDASTEMLRQARRCLHAYIAWLLDEALPGHRSWANDEVQRAVRRLVELEMAERAARPRLH